MRTNRLNILYVALFLAALSSCVKEQPFSSQKKEGIVLELFVEGSETKATTTRDGVDDLNENVLANTVDVFLYDETTLEIKKEAIGAIRSGNLVQLPTNPNDIEAIFGTLGMGATCGLFVVANFDGTYLGTAGSRTITQVKNSFLAAPNWETLPRTSFVMTAEQQVSLRNAQGSTPIYESVYLSRVAAKVTFDVTVATTAGGEAEEGGESNPTWTAQTDGMSVYLVYAMRKATLAANPVPMPASAGVAYQEGGGTIVYNQYVDKVLYDTGTTKQRPRGNTSVDAPVYSTTYQGEQRPFYTYPMEWETGSAMEPYMKLIIPWQYNGTTRKYYYKIPFHGNSLERNHWYHISIDVQILGTEQADPPEVGITYAVADWRGTIDATEAGDYTSQTSMPATVITARYLNIPTTEYVLYNEDDLIIPIQSSHDLEIVGFTVSSDAYQASHQVDANYVGTNPRIYNPYTNTENSSIIAVRPNFSATTTTSVPHSFTPSTTPDSDGWLIKIDGRDSITFRHPLNRDLSSSSYDVAPYTIRFRVRHENDETGYFSDITIEQRPSIIIRPQTNSGGNSNYGYAFVNGAQNNSSDYGDNWRNNTCADDSWTGYPRKSYGGNSVWDYWTYYLGSGPSTVSESNSNANTNMYVIETTVLPTSGDIANYVLGDPRVRVIDNLSGGNTEWSASKPAVEGGSRRIKYYYPSGGSEYDNFIAPKLRVASSYGATYLVTFENARRRCAAYQEDGYPAGRWRLPTVAEIKYIALLNTDGKIFRLLGSQSKGSSPYTSDYWCNSGYMTVYDGKNSDWSSNGNRIPSPVQGTSFSSTDTKYIRCVYDEWYWEDTTYATLSNKGTFTWGDQDRSAVRIAE